jgi:transcriptional regulator with XRE-family HTH domain
MGRRERPLVPGLLHDFARDLRDLRAGTGLTYRALAREARYAPSALSAAAGGDCLPTASVLEAYVRVCGGEPASWEERRRRLAEELARADPDLRDEDELAQRAAETGVPAGDSTASVVPDRQPSPGMSRVCLAEPPPYQEGDAASAPAHRETGD